MIELKKCGHVGPVEDFLKTKHKCKKCQAEYDIKFRAKKLAEYDPNAIRERIYCRHVGPTSGFRERKNECNSCAGENAKKSRTKRLENFDPTKIKTCIYCGCRLDDNFHVDHIIPLTREGTSNWPSNLQLLCPSCNPSKGAKTHEEYLEYRRVMGLPIFREAA